MKQNSEPSEGTTPQAERPAVQDIVKAARHHSNEAPIRVFLGDTELQLEEITGNWMTMDLKCRAVAPVETPQGAEHFEWKWRGETMGCIKTCIKFANAYAASQNAGLREEIEGLKRQREERGSGWGALWVCYHALKDSQWENVHDNSHKCPYCGQAEKVGHHIDCMIGNGLRMIDEVCEAAKIEAETRPAYELEALDQSNRFNFARAESAERELTELRAKLAEQERLCGEIEEAKNDQISHLQEANRLMWAERSAAEAEAAALREAAEEILKYAPSPQDFEIGGRYDYGEDCGNAGDVSTLGAAQMHYQLANIVRKALSAAPERGKDGKV